MPQPRSQPEGKEGAGSRDPAPFGRVRVMVLPVPSRGQTWRESMRGLRVPLRPSRLARPLNASASAVCLSSDPHTLGGPQARKTLKAQKLWFAILESQIETGTPYMCYKDACNSKSNQQNLGTIRSSNLCTEIMECVAALF